MSRFSSRIALIGVGSVLVAAGIAGCGDSSDDDSGSALSKDDYIAQAEEICAGVSEELDSLEADFTEVYDTGDTEGAADVLSEGNDKVNVALEELKGLTPPEEDQELIDGWLELGDEQAVASEVLIEAVAQGDEAAIEEAGAKLDELTAEADPIADDYGMAECGSEGTNA